MHSAAGPYLAPLMPGKQKSLPHPPKLIMVCGQLKNELPI
ncbi:hypothetical protein EDC48_102226 [Gibbsiella quercinecans]|nr:hypothetical protein EDC48_102226 [Gibbsiella quercinecans]